MRALVAIALLSLGAATARANDGPLPGLFGSDSWNLDLGGELIDSTSACHASEPRCELWFLVGPLPGQARQAELHYLVQRIPASLAHRDPPPAPLPHLGGGAAAVAAHGPAQVSLALVFG